MLFSPFASNLLYICSLFNLHYSERNIELYVLSEWRHYLGGNAHAHSEVVGRASEMVGGPFNFLTSILYILFFFFLTKQPYEL